MLDRQQLEYITSHDTCVAALEPSPVWPPCSPRLCGRPGAPRLCGRPGALPVWPGGGQPEVSPCLRDIPHDPNSRATRGHSDYG